MKAIIPTGGRGTRMQPVTFSSNKHFIPIANKPLIFYPIETIAETGIKEIGITYNPETYEQVKSLLGDGSQWGLTFTYVLQEKPIGLANIVEVCEEFLHGDPFVFHLGDNIFADGIVEQVDYFRKNKPNGLVTMIHHKDNTRMGVPYFDDRGRLVKYVEKPANPPHDFAIPGLYFADSNFFKAFKGKDRIQPSARGEYEIPAPFQWLIDHDYKVEVVEYKGKWLDPGKFDDWIKANQYMLDTRLVGNAEGLPDTGSVFENRVQVGENCSIVNSQVRGPVVIGDNVVIKNSYIGPYTSIRDETVVEDSHVENSVLMDGVKILNVDQPIDCSLIGSQTVVTKGNRPTSTVKLFVGNKCQIEL